MNVQVVVQTDDGQERSEIFQPKGPISIGRHPNCVLRLESDLVSRQHAVVEVRPQSIVVEDVSTNGTLAGDRLLRRESVEIPFGTPIVVGNFTIYLLALDAQQQPMQQPMRPAHMPAPPPMASYGPPPMPATGMIPHAASTGALPVTTGIPAVGMSGAIPQATGSAPAATGHIPAVGGGPSAMRARGANGQPVTGKQLNKDVVAAAAERDAKKRAREKDVHLRREAHKMLLEHLDLATIDAAKLEEPSMRPKVLNALRRIIQQLEVGGKVPPEIDRDRLIGELSDEALGLGPLERFLADPTISEIMVVDPETIYIEQRRQDRARPRRASPTTSACARSSSAS